MYEVVYVVCVVILELLIKNNQLHVMFKKCFLK